MGQVHLKDLALKNGIDAYAPEGVALPEWSLMESWAEGDGVQEHAEILSLADFVRAENTLKEPSTMEEIDSAHLIKGLLGEERDDHETFQYSVKETGKEQQNPNSADDNLATDIGRLKRGTGDPDAFYRGRKKNAYQLQRLLMQMNALERNLAEIELRIKQLSAQIKRIKAEIEAETEKLEGLTEDAKDLEELKEFMDEGGDLNELTPRGRAFRRSFEAQMSKNNIPKSEYTNSDGTIDLDRANDLIEQRQTQNSSDISESEAILERLRKQQQDAESELDSEKQKKDDLIETASIAPDRVAEISALVENETADFADDDYLDFMASMDGDDFDFGDDDAFSDDMFSYEANGPDDVEIARSDDDVLKFYEDDIVHIEGQYNDVAHSEALAEALAEAPNQSQDYASLFNDGSDLSVITPEFLTVSDPVLAQQELDRLATLQANNVVQLPQLDTNVAVAAVGV